MRDIARKAGVSVMTVSRALNNKSDISSETKNLILKIARNMNYTPDGLAKGLTTRKTNTVGVIIPTMDNFYAEVVDGIGYELRERGYSLILCNSHGDADEEIKLIRLLREKRVDGMIINPLQKDNRYVDELKSSQISFVFFNRYTEALKCDYVVNDNVYGAYLAVDHLIQKGHRRIIYLCAKPAASSGKERIAGCKKAITDNGLHSDSLKVVMCQPTIESCYKIVKEIISEQEEFSAIFVWDDHHACGAYKAIFEAGMHIPNDIALVGYDDIEISKYLFPPLTTIRQANYSIGENSARVLLDRLNSNDSVSVRKIVIRPELMVREST